MQPYLFPYIGYFQLIKAVDKFVIYDDVNFINKGWINRNKILVNNNANLFTVPLKNSSQNKLIKDIQISESRDWRSKFLKSLELSYKKAPFYEEVFKLLLEIIQNKENNISKFIYFSLLKINEYLKIRSEIIESSSVYSNSELRQQNRIIDICRKENADEYVNPSGGKELYSKELFESNGIKLQFMESKKIQYNQFDNGFVDSLSIIDLLMFNSKERLNMFLNEYSLV